MPPALPSNAGTTGSDSAWSATTCCVLDNPDGAGKTGRGSAGSVYASPSKECEDCTGCSQKWDEIAARTSWRVLERSGVMGIVMFRGLYGYVCLVHLWGAL